MSIADKHTETIKAIQAIADGYSYSFDGSYGAYLVVDNPDYNPINGENPKLVVELQYGTRDEL